MGKRRDKIRRFFRLGGVSTSTTPSRAPSAASSYITEQYVLPTNLPADQATTAQSGAEPHFTATATTPGCAHDTDSPSIILHAPEPLNETDSEPIELQQATEAAESITETTPASTEPKPATELTGQQSPEPSISQRLWNAAYDSLEKDKDKNTAELAKSYAGILTKILQTEAALSVSSSEDDIPTKLKDPIKRQEYMKKLVDEGQKKVATLSKTLSTVGDVAKFVLSAKGMIDAAIQNIPQAALPWAGVCIGLQILLNPGKASKANLTGIAHVTSRMSWYCALTEHLLNKENTTIGKDCFEKVMRTLEKEIIELYRALILYQMASAYSYYRNQGTVLLRGLANLDDWDGLLESIKKVEAIVEQMSAQYCREYEKSSLRQLVNSGQEIETQLGDIHLDLRNFITQQIDARMDDEYTECLRSLSVANPLYDMERIEHNKDRLLGEAFSWILSTAQFAAFTNWINDDPAFSPCRLLWIKGPAGTGKTMLLIGIIRELTKHSATLSPNVSHFFCQGTDNTRNSATAVLKSLIWMLLVQQPYLISHLHAKYKYSGPSLFIGSNAYFVLSDVFKSMLNDSRFSRAYLIVDALDECGEDLDLLIQLVSTSITACEKVKWLVASRPEVKLKNSDTAGALLQLDSQNLEGPVHAYIDHKLAVLRDGKGYSDAIMDSISSEIQLERVNEWDAVETIKEIPDGLSKLYDHMMIRIERFHFGYRPKDAQPPDPDPLAPMRYSCLFWADHFCDASKLENEGIDDEAVWLFLKDHLLHWLESLSLLGKIPDGARSIRTILLKTLDHGGEVCALAFSPDGKTLASASNMEVRLRDATTGVLQQTLQYTRTGYGDSALTFSPDSKMLALATRAPQQTPEGSCKLLALASEDQTIQLWNTATATIYQTLEGHDDRIRAIAFLPDGKTLASASDDQTIRLWDTTTGTLQQTSRGNWFVAIMFSPDGKTLVSTSKYQPIQLWDPATGVLQRTVEGHYDLRAIVFSPDSKILAAESIDDKIRLWDITTGALLQIIEGYDTAMYSMTFTPDGNILATAGFRGTIQLWDAIIRAPLQQTVEGHADRYIAVTFSADGKTLASASREGTMRLWDAATGTLQQIIESHIEDVREIASSPDSKTLALAADDGTIELWDITTKTLQQTIQSLSGWVDAMAFAPDGKALALGSRGGKISLFDIATGEVQQALETEFFPSAIAFSPDGKTLAAASYTLSKESVIQLWDVATGELRQKIQNRSDRIFSIAFSPDGQFLSINGGRIINLFPDSDVHPPYEPWDNALSINDGWVTKGGKKLLWLPPDYRPNKVAAHGDNIALLLRGKLISFRFNF
ncbi:hypothetical protein V8C35DRAFT_319713 [Trichoderma chlorosporum]